MPRVPPSTICSRAPSSATRPTSTSSPGLRPPCACTASSSRSRTPTAQPDDTQTLLYRILSTEQQKQLEINRQLDLSYGVPGLARFRVNVYFQREALGAAFRLIPEEIKTLEELGLPAVARTSSR